MAKSDPFWQPTLIDTVCSFVRNAIPLGAGVLAHERAYVRNIGYNLQYLEYLNHLIEEEPLHATVSTLTAKSFVVTGMSVVESVLWYVLKSNKLQRTEEWEQVTSTDSAPFVESGATYKLVSTLQRKLPVPIEVEMPLDAMIKRVESKKLLGVGTQVYRDLNYLRKLRNRVHIHSVQHDQDTDWWNFSTKEVKLMKGVLHSLFTSSLFHPDADDLERLKYLQVAESLPDIDDTL